MQWQRGGAARHVDFESAAGRKKVGMDLLETVADLMSQLREGRPQAAGRLVAVLYPELRRLAAAKMARERPDHTWQPTVLVHELYMELTRLKSLPMSGLRVGFNAKAAFLSLAGKIMERRLIDHARPLYRRMPKVMLAALESVEGSASDDGTLRYIEEILTGLSSIDPRFRSVVELRVFMGMTIGEIARHMNCSERTAATHWSFARRWLAQALDRGLGTGGRGYA